jgi:hypothetical protein
MSNNKPITLSILSMIGFYLLCSFVEVDFNAKNWDVNTRIFCICFAPVFSLIAYVSTKIEQEQ